LRWAELSLRNPFVFSENRNVFSNILVLAIQRKNNPRDQLKKQKREWPKQERRKQALKMALKAMV
jgi:hypothetical protein